MAVTRSRPGAVRNAGLARAGLGCVLLGLAGATAAESPGCTNLDTVAWLVGAWQAESRDRLVSETWVRVSPVTIEGRGVTRSRTDGAIRDSEDLRLVAMGDGVFYVAKVSHNQHPVAFRLTACGGNTLVFENAAHDFPRRIEYRRVDGTRVEVHVSDGADRGFRLDFTRQPAS